MEDSEIIGLYWRRSEKAVEAAAEKYGGYCAAIAGRILDDPEDAKECVNDTWLSAWNSIPPQKPEKLSVYLGRLTRNLSLNRADLSQKVGDYPITGVKEAQALLCAGNYITTVPEAFPGEEHIAKVELIYRDSRLDQYFMPYYRFYVEVPDMAQDNGLKTFGAYYVPAVSGEFLTGMPVWDGQFN